MRVLLPVMIGLLALSLASARAGDEAKKKAELKWARSVADDFLAAMKAEDYKSASALLTGEYAKIFQGQSVPAAVPEALQEKLRGNFVKVTISSEDISPDKDEARFKGQVERPTETQAFVLRVVKEKESARWRVGFLQIDEARAKAKEPMKLSAEGIGKQWTYPPDNDPWVGQTNGNLRWLQLEVKKKGSYHETFAAVVKFYGQKCGSTTDYTQPRKLTIADKGEAKDGGKFIASDLGLNPRSMIFVYDRAEYTVTVTVSPGANESVWINLTVATR